MVGSALRGYALVLVAYVVWCEGERGGVFEERGMVGGEWLFLTCGEERRGRGMWQGAASASVSMSMSMEMEMEMEMPTSSRRGIGTRAEFFARHRIR